MNCAVGHRCSSDLASLWLCRRLTATAPIGTPAWELSYAMGTALKKQQQQKTKNKKPHLNCHFIPRSSIPILIANELPFVFSKTHRIRMLLSTSVSLIALIRAVGRKKACHRHLFSADSRDSHHHQLLEEKSHSLQVSGFRATDMVLTHS